MATDKISELKLSSPKSFRLDKSDPGDKLGWSKDSAIAELELVKVKLDELQKRLSAEAARSVLLVLQARDAAGKDGTVRSIFSGLNPAGVDVTSFKVPEGREKVQDYLWRVHMACPPDGEIGVFNRSHYEDVLVVRVKGFVPDSVWKKRYRHINEFERMLTDEGTTIIKCFLNVSKEEQARRFQERLDDPTKRWKFREGDLADRKLWPEFEKAYNDVLTKTSTSYAPWYVIPADHNWVRNLAVAKILLQTLKDLDPKYPEPEIGTKDIKIT
ncbi:MAG TPA: polyphosphate kinase 2 family protein [Ilumatobacteraceae bacterium]|jgi:PPK2 family polyphosphate:nucleotide phosphotransferase|nr:polyphosphate kinase 2 family protein [Ilumatobacteraceae bacterium]